ncbi:MAG: ATP-binding protein [Pseudomonadota bacterium]
MAIPNNTRVEFEAKVKQCLSISPIRSRENLMGRDAKLEIVIRALETPGRSVFIFGDRGVGKTSLAATSAEAISGGKFEPVLIGCSADATFVELLQTAVRRMHGAVRTNSWNEQKEELFSIIPDMYVAIERGEFGRFTSQNDVIDMLRYLSQFYPSSPIIIIDEFNELLSVDEKKKFADFAKQLTDQSAPIKIIFCGIGSSMEELMGLHASIGRSIMPVELERLDDLSLWSIVDHAAAIVEVGIDRETNLRTAILSDGFPYFVHLVTEYMFWEAFHAEEERNIITVEDFGNAVVAAIPHADNMLRETYEKATKKYKNSEEYEEVLWAYADAPTLTRQSQDVYDQSYLAIVRKRNKQRRMRNEKTRPVLPKDKFDQRLAKLKTEAYGEILRWRRSGWYEFRENMMRGFVRIRAREAGVELGIDHHHVSKSSQLLRDLLSE